MKPEQVIRTQLDDMKRSLDTLREIVGVPGRRESRAVAAWANLRLWMQRGYPTGGQGGTGYTGSRVENAVISDDGLRYDPTVKRATRDIASFEDDLETAKLALARAEKVAVSNTVTTLKPGKDDDDLWCENHARHNMAEPVGERGKGWCRWCEDFERAEGTLPPKDVLEKRARGERITAQVVDRALGRRRKVS